MLFVDSADKAARFIRICNAFNVPLLFLADVPGFMIGTDVERQGIIRHGAKMISAVSEATVPKISVVVRKAYGAGLYAMAGPAFEPDAASRCPPRRSPWTGAGTGAGEVVVTSCAEEGIFLLYHAILRPGDHAIVETPCYESALQLARSTGAEVTSGGAGTKTAGRMISMRWPA